MKSIDINSDVGESFGPYKIGDDENVFQRISSANIACGYHGGDPLVMRKSVQLAKEKGINIGAHPGLPDMAGFGRRKMDVTAEEAKNYVIYQIGSLWGFCRVLKTEVKHVKIHGAFSGMAAKDEKIAKAIVEGIREVDDKLLLYCRPGTALALMADKQGIRQVDDFPVDRAVNVDNTMVDRRLPGAVIEDVAKVVARTIRLVKEGTLETFDGKVIELHPRTICIHGDNPNAVNLLTAISTALRKEGIEIMPFTL